MQITSVSYPKTTYYNKPAKQASFGGLTRLFEKTVYDMPYKRAQQLVSLYKKPDLFVGHFPQDILGILKKSASSGADLKERIQTFNRELARLTVGIRMSEESLMTQLYDINLDNYTYRALCQSAQNGKDASIGWVSENIKLFLTPEQMEKQVNSSGFEETMKKIGLIPEDGKVKISYVGKGTYKKCFKLNFLDKEGNDIIHPKALVMGQCPDFGWTCNRHLHKIIGKYLSALGLDGFKKRMEIQMKMDVIGSDKKEKIREMIEFFYNGHYKTSRIFNGATIIDEYNNINGIFPEANAALKIRKDLGKNIGDSNIITPYIFDLKSKCGLLEFADEGLSSAKTRYDFKKHGLEWLDEKMDNYGKTCPKIVDFGSIVRADKADYYRW